MLVSSSPNLEEIVEIGEGSLDRSLPGECFHHREHLITIYLVARYA